MCLSIPYSSSLLPFFFLFFFCFFFQAEDGIRDTSVTGVQTCALPISIMANTFEVATTDLLPGHRPVAVSKLPVADLHFLPGNRPIASNDVVDPIPSVLMGYLD